MNKFYTTLIVSLVFLIIINTVNLNNLNQATAVTRCGKGIDIVFGFGSGGTGVMQDCCSWTQDTAGHLVPASLTCKRSFCGHYDLIVGRCITLSVISPLGGAGNVSAGSGELPPSIAPGDSGSRTLPPSIAPGDSGTENNNETEINTGQNTDDTSTSSNDESKDTKDRSDLSLEPLNPPNEESNKFEPEMNATD